MADVFISYHEKSAGEIVKQIAVALENSGVSCWYAQRDLTDFGAYAATIAGAIRHCKIFLLVLNEESTQSEHVKNEIGVAFSRIKDHEKMSLALFRLDGCILPDDVYYYLNRFQITDGNPPDAQKIQRLSGQIRQALREQPLADKAPQTQKFRVEKDGRKFLNKILFSTLFSGLGIILFCLLIFASSRWKRSSWELKDGALIIYDTHAMENYNPSSNPPPWYSNRQNITSAAVSDRITFIGNYLFYDCVNLQSVTIGKNVVSIGDSSFRHCTSLDNIQIPKSVTYVGLEAFSLCSQLSEIEIPDSVNTIAANAFKGCKNLSKVRISDNLGVIEIGTFCDCESLTRIDIPDSVIAIEYQAFDGCINLTSVTLSQNVIELGYKTFGNCQNLPAIIIPNSMQRIHESAFSGCKSLTSASVPTGLNIDGVFPEGTVTIPRPVKLS